MSEPTNEPAAPPPPAADRRPPAAPLFCWLVIQLIALAIAVFRVPLAARFPQPSEQFALHVMLVTQVAASAMLFPLLMRDAKTAVMVILTIAPFVQLSSYLASSVPLSRAALAALYVAVWLVTLALWRATVRSRRGEMLAVACAIAISLGGVILWYIRAESREPGPIDWSRDGAFGPILGAIAQLHAPAVPSAWLVALLVLLLSAVICIAARKRRVERSGNSPAAP